MVSKKPPIGDGIRWWEAFLFWTSHHFKEMGGDDKLLEVPIKSRYSLDFSIAEYVLTCNPFNRKNSKTG
jgi:hypothetical protein